MQNSAVSAARAQTPARGSTNAALDDTRDCVPIFDIDTESLYDFPRLRTVSPPENVEGQRIAKIQILPLPIFDENNPRENHWLYRLANRYFR